MGKKYDISKKSDMKRFGRDLEKMVVDQAKDAMTKIEHEVECPSCQKTISIRVGKNVCPFCKQDIELTAD